MRKVWIIAWNALTRLARDRKALITLLLMPMVLIGILGAALNSALSFGKIPTLDVIVVNADKPAKPATPPGTPQAIIDKLPETYLGKLLIDDVLGSEQVKEILRATVETDLEAAKQKVTDGKALSVIYVRPFYSADVLAGKPTTVEVYSDPANPTAATIVEQVVRAFTEQVTTANLAGHVLGPDQAQQFVQETTAHLPKLKQTTPGTKDVKAMQYYAAAMAIMFMVMTAFNRAKEILTDKEEGTLARVLTTPTGRVTLVAGQILGNMLVLLVQFIVLMIGTRLLYKVDWGNWGYALVLGTAFALAAAGIGTAAAGMLNDPKAADAAMGIVSNLFAALSGSMFPLYNFPDGMKLVAHFIPNYWALQGFLDQMAAMGPSFLVTPVLVLSLIGVATGGLGAWRLATK
jgi:ABC-2 type transport system permease protein